MNLVLGKPIHFMDYHRRSLLKKFFNFHGVLSNQDVIFRDAVIDKLSKEYSIRIEDENDIKYIRERESYNISTDKFEVPMMNSKGYFIIQGVEKVPLIQEGKRRNCMFVSREDNYISCETKFPGARNSLKLMYSEEVYIRLIIGDSKNVKLYVSNLLRRWNFNINRVPLGRKEEIKISLEERDNKDDTDAYSYFVENVQGDAKELEVCNTILYMLNMCISVAFDLEKETDRDHCGNKMFQTSGDIISSLMEKALLRKSGKIRDNMEDEVYSVMKTGTIRIGNEMRSKMVVQVGTRSLIDTISSIRRIIVPADYNSTNLQMRQISKSQIGFICPSETPEGKQVGLVKNLASTCVISPKMEDLYETILDLVSQESRKGWVIYDGVVIGFSKKNTIDSLLSLKRKYRYLSVSKNINGDIFVRTSNGRLMRPLIRTNRTIVDWNKIEERSWDELIEDGFIEYLDPLEIDYLNIADLSYQGHPENYTHMEIHPSTMFGIASSTVPLINHNQGARAIFASSMVKQAMQCPPEEDRDGKFLLYSQRPLVSTGINDVLELPQNGINVIVCIMSYSGYNQEDAIIMKRSFVERGAFMMMNNKIRRLENPIGGRKIVESGKNIWVIDGIGDKIVNEYVADGFLGDTEVISSEIRSPQVGDKFASRHAQKGVVGSIMDEVDMPCTFDGIVPDLIINPHSIPSRMTMGQIIEGIEGKRCAIQGHFFDGTPFQDMKIKDLSSDHKVNMICGITGEILEEPVSIGIVYYMALTHQVKDKIYIRSSGPRSEFSHQPVSGKAKGGGLRFGEMEMDVLLAHGTSNTIRNISNNSDMENFRVCSNCGNFPVCGTECNSCNTGKIDQEDIPYSMKVLKDLLIAYNMDTKILTQ